MLSYSRSEINEFLVVEGVTRMKVIGSVQRPRGYPMKAIRGESNYLLGLVMIFIFPDPKDLILISPVYPSETHPFGPIFRESLPTDRLEVLAKYGAWTTTLGNRILIFNFYFWNSTGKVVVGAYP